MSGSSYDNRCPNCGEDMRCYSDHKPFDTVNGECINCGFCYYTKTGQMKLEELNYQRQDYNENNDYKKRDKDYLPPLKKLPKCNLDEIY